MNALNFQFQLKNLKISEVEIRVGEDELKKSFTVSFQISSDRLKNEEDVRSLMSSFFLSLEE